MPYKLTMFFSLNRSAWSEAYLNSGSYPGPNLPPGAGGLIDARVALLGRNATMFAIRVSSFPANRIVADLDNFAFPTTGQWPGSEGLSEQRSNQANVSLLVKCTTPVGSKLIYVAGVPDGVITGDATPPVNVEMSAIQGFPAAMDVFLNQLTQNGWGCRSWKATAAVQALGLQAGPQVPPLVGVQLGALQPWTVGQKVLLGGWRRLNPRSPGLSGVFNIAGVPPATQTAPPYVYYLLGTQNVSPTNFKTVGTIGLLTFEVAPFLTASVDKGVTRKRGGRSLLPLGRLLRSH